MISEVHPDCDARRAAVGKRRGDGHAPHTGSTRACALDFVARTALHARAIGVISGPDWKKEVEKNVERW